MYSPLKRLLVRFFVLTILVALTAFSLSRNEPSATAAVCCFQCRPDWEACYDQCYASAVDGVVYPPCLRFCDRQYEKCNTSCDPGC